MRRDYYLCLLDSVLQPASPKKENVHMKNWHPVSMLSVIYKLASAAIANRIKPCLNDIIDKKSKARKRNEGS